MTNKIGLNTLISIPFSVHSTKQVSTVLSAVMIMYGCWLTIIVKLVAVMEFFIEAPLVKNAGSVLEAIQAVLTICNNIYDKAADNI